MYAALIGRLCISSITTTVFLKKNMSAELSTCAAVLKALSTRRKPANTNHIIFFCAEKNLNQDQTTNSQYVRQLFSDPKDVSIATTTHSGWILDLDGNECLPAEQIATL